MAIPIFLIAALGKAAGVGISAGGAVVTAYSATAIASICKRALGRRSEPRLKEYLAEAQTAVVLTAAVVSSGIILYHKIKNKGEDGNEQPVQKENPSPKNRGVGLRCRVPRGHLSRRSNSGELDTVIGGSGD